MITGIDRPTSGEIIVTGKPVHKMSEDRLAAWRGENVGIIFQFFQMLPRSAAAECHPADGSGRFAQVQTQREARASRASAGNRRLGDQMHKLPSMSRRPATARCHRRALANDPPLLIADEPTGNLDSPRRTMCLTFLTKW